MTTPLKTCFLLGLFGASGAVAASNLSFTLGVGSDEYETYVARASLDVPKLPLKLDLDYSHYRSSNAELLTQQGAGLTWNPNAWITTSYRYTEVKEEFFSLHGNEFAVSVYVNQLWKSRLYTRLDFNLGDYAYQLNQSAVPPGARGVRVPDQRRYTLGFSQNLTEDVYLFASYDEYRYSANPAVLASLLIRPMQPPPNAVSSLTSFPKVGRTIGMGWYVTNDMLVEASYYDTDSVIAQAQDVKKIKLSYQFNKDMALNAALSSSDSAGLIGINGQQVSAPSSTKILELGVSYSF